MATRWGICSAGLICEDFVSSLSVLPASDHKVVAVAARQLDRAQSFADKFEIPKAYGSYEELAKEDNIDIIYVGSIHKEHHQNVLLFLNNNNNVLCEKPVALNSKQLREMRTLAREKKLFFMEAVWTRFFPAFGEVLDELARGTLGNLHNMQIMFAVPICHWERLNKIELDGGGLIEIGTYLIHVALFIFGKPDKITVEGHLGKEVDQSACIIFKYKDGRMAQLMYSVMFQGNNDAVIYGSKGNIKICGDFWHPTEVIFPTGKQEFPLPFSPHQFNYGSSCGLHYEADHVRQCLRAGKTESPLVPMAHSEDVMTILDHIRREIGVRCAADMTS